MRAGKPCGSFGFRRSLPARAATVLLLVWVLQGCLFGTSDRLRDPDGRQAAMQTSRDPSSAPDSLRVEFFTAQGSFSVVVHPRWAPLHVDRFLALRDSYEGSIVCKSHAGGFLVFGCRPPDADEGQAMPVGENRIVPDEIDGGRMAHLDRPITDPKEIENLWQREIYPRYRRLHALGQPVPLGLGALVENLRRDGMKATDILAGKTRRWYLETIGFRYTAGASPLPVRRGAVASISMWPGESDGRFLIALAPIPERSGRSTVFGEIVAGMDVLDAIAALPVNKSHEPRNNVYLDRISLPAGRILMNEN